MDLLSGSPYEAYLYSYPHKTAYRAIEPAIPLRELWAEEKRDALSLYVHVPFCEQRCGFCNLFTVTGVEDDGVEAFLASLERQARATQAALPDARYARFALGGGTPTYLEPRQLDRVLRLARSLGADLDAIPCSVETSPQTATADALGVLREHGIDRVSMGVQSLVDAENASVHRRQARAEVEAAVERMRALGFPTINLDLMYGLPEQTMRTWLDSVRAVIALGATEIYLYPLYVRPLTVLGKQREKQRATAVDPAWDEARLAMYREARDLLRAEGFAQISMRMFRRVDVPRDAGPVYCCQADGMVGLGCGARSYTERVHYASAYAVGAKGVRGILERYAARTEAEHAVADWGYVLDDEDRRRRFVILSLLSDEGLDLDAYRSRFGSDALEELAELRAVVDARFATREGARVTLTELGLERCDRIGPALRSARVVARMNESAVR